VREQRGDGHAGRRFRLELGWSRLHWRPEPRQRAEPRSHAL
jgi:hypothetical protein